MKKKAVSSISEGFSKVKDHFSALVSEDEPEMSDEDPEASDEDPEMSDKELKAESILRMARINDDWQKAHQPVSCSNNQHAW
jgi:hypothetical protein